MSNIEKQYSNDGIPVPVVTFSRWVYVSLLTISLILQVPGGITFLLLLLLPGLLFGKRWNFISRVGGSLLKKHLAGADKEDTRLIQFNNWLLVIMLLAAQAAFITGLKIAAWSIVVTIIGVTGVALSGFCVGCFFYYHFKLYRYRFSINN